MEKYNTAGLAKDDKIAHAHWMLDTKGLKHKITVINICFSTGRMVAQKRLSVSL
jgi:hypothetical protein